MSIKIIVDQDTMHELLYDPNSLDDDIHGYETCRIQLDLDLTEERIDSETHTNIIYLLNEARNKVLRPNTKQDVLDSVLLFGK